MLLVTRLKSHLLDGPPSPEASLCLEAFHFSATDTASPLFLPQLLRALNRDAYTYGAGVGLLTQREKDASERYLLLF